MFGHETFSGAALKPRGRPSRSKPGLGGFRFCRVARRAKVGDHGDMDSNPDSTAGRAAISREERERLSAEGEQPVKLAPWAIALIVSNLVALVGGFASAASWKATVETEMRLGRERTSEEFAALRGQLTQRTDAIAARLDRYESGQSTTATLQFRVEALSQQINEQNARIRALESERRR